MEQPLNGTETARSRRKRQEEPDPWEQLAPELVAFLRGHGDLKERLPFNGEITLELVGSTLQVIVKSHEMWQQKRFYIQEPAGLWEALEKGFCDSGIPVTAFQSRKVKKPPKPGQAFSS